MGFQLAPGSEDFIDSIKPDFQGNYIVYYKDGTQTSFPVKTVNPKTEQEHQANLADIQSKIKKNPKYTGLAIKGTL